MEYHAEIILNVVIKVKYFIETASEKSMEGMFKADLPPTAGILAAARRLVFRMKGNRKLGEPDTEAVKEFFDEVKSFKH